MSSIIEDNFNAWLELTTKQLKERSAEIDKWAEAHLSPEQLADYKAFNERCKAWLKEHPGAVRLPADFK